MVEVTQADREAAAAAYAREHSVSMDCLICSAILAGEEDCQEIVQRFARHRLAERDAVVKWLRRCRANKLAHHRSVCHYEDDEILDAIITAADTFGYSADDIEAGEHRK